MRSAPGYLARITEAGRPGDAAALRPPRPLFAPDGGPPLVAGADGETRPPRLTPAAPARSGGGATIASRHDEPAFDARRPRPARGPGPQQATGFRTGGAAGPPAAEPVIFPGPAGPTGPPPRRAGADRQPTADETYAAVALERPSRPARDPGPGRKQPVHRAAVVPAATPSPDQGGASASAATGFAARRSQPGPEPGKSAREEGASASQRPARGLSASPAHGSAQGLSRGWPHDRAAASAVHPDSIPELTPSPGPQSARDGNPRAAVSGQPAGPALHGAGPARVTIGTIEVTVVPPAPPPPSPAPARTLAPQRPRGDAVRHGARRWFGTGQI
jgi:hypothetical protein